MMNLTINRIDAQLVKYKISFSNICVELLNLGATIYDVKTFDRFGRLNSIVLKYDKPQDYKNNQMYLGTTTGPYAGRIENGTFTFNNQIFNLPKNDGDNHLHGGPNGLSHKYFDIEIIQADEQKITLLFTTKIATADDNLPGELLVKVIYTITNEEINIKYEAKSSEDGRIVNITNHTYWNLSGDIRHNITDTSITANTKFVWDSNESNISSKKMEVPEILDFSNGTTLRELLRNPITLLKDQKGLDNAFEIPDKKITISHRTSGRSVTISSDQDTAVIYTQNFPSHISINHWPTRSTNLGIACEFQSVPNDINRDEKANSFVYKDQIWTREINFKFHTNNASIFKKALNKLQK